MQAAILGKKIGMTSLFTEDGQKIPCTVIEAGPCPVVTKREPEKDGYSALQIGFEDIPDRKVNGPLKGHFAKNGISPKRHLKEFRDLNIELNIGDTVTVEQFEIGDRVKISGISKGRGFQGVMKRHHFGGVGMMSHGQSDRQRHPGSIGQSSDPSRVMKGIRMAGQMGNKRATIRNLQVVDIIPERNIMLIKGSIPGGKNSIIEIVKK
ncbi:MAG: 50S ribosomal protein L3 [Candidatus Kapaibacterium sp.]